MEAYAVAVAGAAAKVQLFGSKPFTVTMDKKSLRVVFLGAELDRPQPRS